MPKVNVYTAERVKEIEDKGIVGAEVVDNHLILTRHDDSTFDAGELEIIDPASAVQVSQITADETITVGPGGDFTTINAALAALSVKAPTYVALGRSVQVALLSGFVAAEQVAISRMDLSFITLVAEDPTVIIDRTALASKVDRWRSFWRVSEAKSPHIAVLFDMDTSGDATDRVGFYVRNNSDIVYGPGAGCVNAAIRGIDAPGNSRVYGPWSVWSGAGEIGARISNSTSAMLEDMVSTGCGVANVACGGTTSVKLARSNLSGSLGKGLLATSGASVNCTDADVSDAASIAIDSQAANIDAGGSDTSGAGTFGFSVLNGGFINKTGAIGTVSQPENVPSGAGIIFDNGVDWGDSITIPVLNMAVTAGTPTPGSTGGYLGMLFDPDTTETVTLPTVLPRHWKTYHADLIWTVPSGAGAVRWQYLYQSVGVGESTLSTTPIVSTPTAPAANTLAISRLASSLVNTSGNLILATLSRLGVNAADTHTADALCLAIRLSRVS